MKTNRYEIGDKVMIDSYESGVGKLLAENHRIKENKLYIIDQIGPHKNSDIVKVKGIGRIHIDWLIKVVEIK